MAKTYAKSFYNSSKWKRCRSAYIDSTNGGLCEWCEKQGKVTLGYIVDHVIEITPDNINDAAITLNHDNLQYLCLECHNKKTFKKSDSVPDDCYFDENGNLVYNGD